MILYLICWNHFFLAHLKLIKIYCFKKYVIYDMIWENTFLVILNIEVSSPYYKKYFTKSPHMTYYPLNAVFYIFREVIFKITYVDK